MPLGSVQGRGPDFFEASSGRIVAWESSTAPQTIPSVAPLPLDIQTSPRTGHPRMFPKLHPPDGRQARATDEHFLLFVNFVGVFIFYFLFFMRGICVFGKAFFT